MGRRAEPRLEVYGLAVLRLERRESAAEELGHGGPDLVRRIYGHLGTVRHRVEVVEYRAEQHRAIVGSRLDAIVAADTAVDTAGAPDRLTR